MKRIVNILLLILCLYLVVGCSTNIKIFFNINGIKAEIVIAQGDVVYVNDVPVDNYNVIDGLYYDSNFSDEYNNEPINKNITLYVKLKQKIVHVSFYLNGIISKVILPIYSVVNNDNVPLVNKEELIGIYYDANYDIPYNDEMITEDITLYVKTSTGNGYLQNIDEAFVWYIQTKYSEKFPNRETDFSSYLGTYNGKYILVFHHSNSEDVEISGKNFMMKGYEIVVFYNDDIKSLKESYDYNIISDEELEMIHIIYVSQYLEKYGGGVE